MGDDKPKDGELVVVIKENRITDYNRYVQFCMDEHKKEREKSGETISFDDGQGLMENCAEKWKKLSPEEREKYGDSNRTS